MKTRYLFATLLAVVIPLAANAAAPIPDNAEQSITKGLDFLKTQQKPDGSWERPGDPPAMTALPLKAFLGDPNHDADEPFLEKGFDKLLSYQKSDGGIFNDVLANYNTAIAISALAASR